MAELSLVRIVRFATLLVVITRCASAELVAAQDATGSLTPASPPPAAASAAPSAPARFRGFRLQVPELAAELRVRGLLQVDGVFFLDDDADLRTDRFEVRRARVALSGKIGELFTFRIEPQFTPGNVTLLDAALDARLLEDALTLRAGKTKTPLGIEMIQSVTALTLPERGLSTALVPTRDIGVQLLGELGGGWLSYAVGVFDGAPDGTTPEGNIADSVDIAGRIFVQPFRATSLPPLAQLGIGMAASLGRESGSAANSGLGHYQTVTRNLFARYQDGVLADGRRYRLNPQLWWYWGSLGVLGEYVYSAQRVRSDSAAGSIGNHAWMLAASYVLTQEAAQFEGVTPSRPWGAIELGARYSELRFDAHAFEHGFLAAGAPERARAWGVALSYWANAVLRVQLAFEQTRFKAFMGKALPPENAVFARAQLAL